MRTTPYFTALVAALVLPAAIPARAARPAEPPAPATLRVQSEPAGAKVFLNDAPVGETPLSTETDAFGTALVRVSLRGHREWWGSVELAPGALRSVDAQLEPVRSAVLVHVRPEGAAVSLDGAHVGDAPVLIPGVPLGRHRVTMSHPGFQSRSVDLEIDGAAPRKIEETLVTDSATIHVSTEPSGARVFLNGVPYGESPVDIDRIPEGTAILEVRAEGYREVRQEMRLAVGDDKPIAIELEALPATLQIVTVPAGARIYVDDAFRGESPLTLEDLTPGQHRVRADLVAHDPMARNVVLRNAESAVEEFHLVPNCGSLRVCTAPAGVTVLVDGKVRGTTAAGSDATDQVSDTLEIDQVLAGRHEVVFTREGFHEQRRTVDVQRDQTLTLDVKLARHFIPDFEIRTAENVYRGVFHNQTAEFVRLETEPGVIRSFPIKTILSRRILREDERLPQEETPQP